MVMLYQRSILLAEIDTIPSKTAPRTIRDYVDTLMARQGRIINAAISSQQKENSANLQRRYAHYSRAPILKRRRNIHGAPQVLVNTMRVADTTTPRTAATKWIIDPDANTFIGPLNYGEEADALQYIPLLTSANGKPVDTINSNYGLSRGIRSQMRKPKVVSRIFSILTGLSSGSNPSNFNV
jgi:hypothetical protein